MLGVTGLETHGVEIVQAVIWSCLALSVPAADVALNWKDLRARSAVRVRPTAPQSVGMAEAA